jgi:hypothetical protein
MGFWAQFSALRTFLPWAGGTSRGDRTGFLKEVGPAELGPGLRSGGGGRDS